MDENASTTPSLSPTHSSQFVSRPRTLTLARMADVPHPSPPLGSSPSKSKPIEISAVSSSPSPPVESSRDALYRENAVAPFRSGRSSSSSAASPSGLPDPLRPRLRAPGELAMLEPSPSLPHLFPVLHRRARDRHYAWSPPRAVPVMTQNASSVLPAN